MGAQSDQPAAFSSGFRDSTGVDYQVLLCFIVGSEENENPFVQGECSARPGVDRRREECWVRKTYGKELHMGHM